MSDVPDFKSEYSEKYKRINVAGVFGGIAPVGLEAVVYSEERMVEKVLETATLSPNRQYIKRTVEAELIFDPMQMKATYLWLGQKIKEYEKIFGPILSPEEFENKARRRDSGE